MLTLNIINKSPNALPAYETIASAGMDIRAHLDTPIQLAPLERKLIPTGLYIELPIGYEAQLRARSGLAFKKGLILPNSPATIDADYRGEIKVILANISTETHTINAGERIAQMVIAKHETVTWQVAAQLNETKRGEGGFGSTGV